MPRSNRAYGDPAPATLANAIAFVHITQSTRGVHMSTCSKLMQLYEFANNRPHYRFSAEALELAKPSPLWHAYEWCLANGYKLDSMRGHSMRNISFSKWDCETNEGWSATITRWGSVFVAPEKGIWKDRTQSFNPYEDAKKGLK